MISLIARNNDNTAPLLYSCMSLGTPFIPLDISFEAAEIMHMFEIVKPQLIICELDRLKAVKMILEEKHWNIPIITFEKSNEADIQCIDDYLVSTGVEDNFR